MLPYRRFIIPCVVFTVRTPLKFIVHSELAGRFCGATFGAVTASEIPCAPARKRSEEAKGTCMLAPSPEFTLHEVVGIAAALLTTKRVELTL